MSTSILNQHGIQVEDLQEALEFAQNIFIQVRAHIAPRVTTVDEWHHAFQDIGQALANRPTETNSDSLLVINMHLRGLDRDAAERLSLNFDSYLGDVAIRCLSAG